MGDSWVQLHANCTMGHDRHLVNMKGRVIHTHTYTHTLQHTPMHANLLSMYMKMQSAFNHLISTLCTTNTFHF